MAMENPHLILIPTPVMGHVTQMVELAHLIIQRETHLSITILLPKLPYHIDEISATMIDSLSAPPSTSDAATQRLHFFQLPPTEPTSEWTSQTRGYYVYMTIKSQQSNVKDFIRNRFADKRVLGFVVDMLCTSMMDVADEFEIPVYVFFTSGAAFLGMMIEFQILHDELNRDVSELATSLTDLSFPSFQNPVPPAVLPYVLTDKTSWLGRFLHYARAYRRAKGLIINTFEEFEPYALSSFLLDSFAPRVQFPRIHAIGPVLNWQRSESSSDSDVMKWLDDQLPSSVVFLCFGSQGSLNETQVKEIAKGLRSSGFRFLWSLRRPAPKDKNAEFAKEYTNYDEVLPERFLAQTAKIGKIVGWVPQLRVLSHNAIGGFVSHCGWNSILESIWFGVPIATWPFYAEQQLNAFQLVKEMGIAVEITLDYFEVNENQPLVTAEVIERGLRKLMEFDSDLRDKVKKLSEKGRASVMPGGASYNALDNLIQIISSRK